MTATDDNQAAAEGPVLEDRTRDELNELALGYGIEDPEGFKNKAEIVDAITAAEARSGQAPPDPGAGTADAASDGPVDAQTVQNDGRPPLAGLAVERREREDESARVINTTDEQED